LLNPFVRRVNRIAGFIAFGPPTIFRIAPKVLRGPEWHRGFSIYGTIRPRYQTFCQVEDQEMNWVAIGSIATARGVIFVGWQIWQTRKQNITAFEDEMSRQYREIPKTIPVEALLGEELSKEELEDAENGIYHYLDLSNEEVFLRQNGRVSSETWKSWCNGIKSNLRRWAFAQVWRTIQSKVPNDFLELQTLEAGHFTTDPRRWRKLIQPNKSA
jgi:hypothetical protein